MVHIYIYIRTLFSYEKKELQPFETMWMELEGIMLSEISHTEKDKYCMISFIYGIEKKKNKTKTRKFKLVDAENRLVAARCGAERNG